MKARNALIGVALLALAVPAIASATGESANVKLPPGTTAINPKTCKFLHKEVDPPTPGPGTTLAGAELAIRTLRVYTLYEDARHDAKMACLTHHMGTNGKRGPAGPAGPAGPRGARGPAGPTGSGLAGYVRVSAPINFKQASAAVSCPTGDVVLGGGATVEVEGSYPSSDSTWIVLRDHRWGNLKVGSVWATCAAVAP
jgi:hypothetical protein